MAKGKTLLSTKQVGIMLLVAFALFYVPFFNLGRVGEVLVLVAAILLLIR